jgi:hypothetical protein
MRSRSPREGPAPSGPKWIGFPYDCGRHGGRPSDVSGVTLPRRGRCAQMPGDVPLDLTLESFDHLA